MQKVRSFQITSKKEGKVVVSALFQLLCREGKRSGQLPNNAAHSIYEVANPILRAKDAAPQRPQGRPHCPIALWCCAWAAQRVIVPTN